MKSNWKTENRWQMSTIWHLWKAKKSWKPLLYLIFWDLHPPRKNRLNRIRYWRLRKDVWKVLSFCSKKLFLKEHWRIFSQRFDWQNLVLKTEQIDEGFLSKAVWHHPFVMIVFDALVVHFTLSLMQSILWEFVTLFISLGPFPDRKLWILRKYLINT